MKNEIRYQKIAALLAGSLRREARPTERPTEETPVRDWSGDAKRVEAAETTETIGGDQ